MLAKAWKDPKIIGLAESLHMPLPHVMGHLDIMLQTCWDHLGRGGRVSPTTLRCLESWAMWGGRKGRFVQALEENGLLVKCGLGYHKIPNYLKNVPDYVRKRWIKQDLTKNPVRTNSGTFPEKGASQDYSSPAVSRPLNSDPIKKDPAESTQAQPSRPPAPKDRYTPEDLKRMVEEERAQRSAGIRVLSLRMAPLLADPAVPPSMLLAQLGVGVKTAAALLPHCDRDRVVQVIRWALEKGAENVPGLVVTCLEKKEWP